MVGGASAYLKIIGVVLFYWTTSISMTFANKYLVGNKFHDIKQDISLFVAWTQCTITILIVLTLHLIQKYVFCYHEKTLPALNRSIILNMDMILMVICFSLMLSLNNVTLKYVGISFFQIARSLTLVFTVILTKLFLRKSTSANSIMSCGVVVLGFFLGVDQENLAGSLSILGVIFGLLSSLCVAATGIFMKRVMENLNLNSYSLVYYMNLGAAVLYFPFLFLLNQFQIVYVSKLQDYWFDFALLLTGVLGLLINLASNLEIGVTSPTTHQISNNAKSVVQTVMAVFIFTEVKPPLWWVSNLLIVMGAISYTVCKFYESSAAV